MTSNLKEAGCEEHTNSRANLWSDEQKSHIRLCMRIRLLSKSKSNNYTESCIINETDGVKIDFMPEIATDGKELIDWITDQDWSDGNVGMFGGSYLGYTQLVVAGQAPEGLKAIFPEVVAMDGYSTEMRPGGVFCQQYSTEDIQTLYEMPFISRQPERLQSRF